MHNAGFVSLFFLSLSAVYNTLKSMNSNHKSNNVDTFMKKSTILRARETKATIRREKKRLHQKKLAYRLEIRS